MFAPHQIALVLVGYLHLLKFRIRDLGQLLQFERFECPKIRLSPLFRQSVALWHPALPSIRSLVN